MGPISVLFPNPAVKILEERLWDDARKRYLTKLPSDRKNDVSAVMRKVRPEYKDTVAAALKEADHRLRVKWGEFKHGMTKELRTALITVFRMSELDWYSVEAGQPSSPDVISVPYELLKYVTGSLLAQTLRKGIDFESLDNGMLEALAGYAVGEKFQKILHDMRYKCEPVEIGDRHSRFVVAEIIRRDAYFLDDENHHSLIDMVILAHADPSSSGGHAPRLSVRRWFHEGKKNRKNDRRFTGDGWEIEFEKLKSWSISD